MRRCNSHIKIEYICLALCVIGILVIGLLYSKACRFERTELENVSVCSEDDSITIKWDSPNWYLCDYIMLQIRDDDKIVYEKNVWPMIEKISYRGGEHGKAYVVSVSAHYRDGSFGENIEKRTLFLEYDQLPKIPLIKINTYSGKDPTYTEREKPDADLWGATITDNEFLLGEMVMLCEGKTISTGIEIRVRGNTSSIYSSKKSYKINLDNACDLLGREENRSCKEWVLLNNGSNLNTYIGNYVGTLCGMEWQPQMMFVNVILNPRRVHSPMLASQQTNDERSESRADTPQLAAGSFIGDWKGCYCLTEAVCLASSYGLVSETGYIFENDAYWWSSEGQYFKTSNQIYQTGYTFKYPKINRNDEKAVLALQNYIQEYEDRILNGDVSYRDYIDEKSYSSWILARDIVGNADGGGSNMYFYKYDFDEENPTSSKVKMGPLWDFDGAFLSYNNWSECRNELVSQFPQLFSQKSFYDEYMSAWEKIYPYLYDNIKAYLNDLENAYKKDIDASWQLNSRRWGVEISSFEIQKNNILDWFSQRIIWMNNSLKIPATESSAIDISGYKHIKSSIVGYIDKEYATENSSYLEGWAFLADQTENPEFGSIGILANERVYLANEYSRVDVQDIYSLSSDQVGFYICKEPGEGTVCIIDIENKVIYEME